MKDNIIRTLLASVAIFAAGALCMAQNPNPTSLHPLDPVPYMTREAFASSKALLPPPPQPGSVEFLVDEYHYHHSKLLRDTPRGRQAIEDADLEDDSVFGRFAEAFGYLVSKEAMPATYHVLKKAQECFGTYGCDEAKLHYNRIRPYVYYGEHSLTPWYEEGMSISPSYPSGHSADYYGLACIMSALNPSRSAEVFARADEGAYSRVIAGCHWLSDTKASKTIALSVFSILQTDPEYLRDFELAKKEIARIDKKNRKQ